MCVQYDHATVDLILMAVNQKDIECWREPAVHISYGICNGCSMGMGNLPDMYAQGPQAQGLRVWPRYKYYVSLCSHSNNTSGFNPTIDTVVRKFISTNC